MQEVSQTDDKFKIKDVLKSAADIVKNNLQFIIILAIIWMGIPSLLGTYAGTIGSEASLSQDPNRINDANRVIGLMGITTSLWGIVIAPGIYRILLKLIDNEKASYTELIPNDLPLLLRVAGASILLSIAIALGLVFLILPGIFLGIKFQFTLWLIIDKQYRVFDALKKSWEMTDGLISKFFILFFALLGVYVVAAIASGIILIPLNIIGEFLNITIFLKGIVKSLVSGCFFTFAFLVIGLIYKKSELSPTTKHETLEP
ncbi:MAG: hypothetical protein QNJ31_03250 [Candidatus Caenarcaniphilales bacterium]|nr:hypothetical protein [Candidatus Caenarcaniphilales bacterium]